MRNKKLDGAPRPMKMGTTRSPWRYDGAARRASQPAKLRQTTILHYAFASGCLPTIELLRSYRLKELDCKFIGATPMGGTNEATARCYHFGDDNSAS
jgi:hypothetical protein